MPKIPRDLSGRELSKLLKAYGYEITRQTGSHIRLTSSYTGQTHNIPDHSPIKIGTLNKIIKEIANYLRVDKEVVIRELFEE